MPSSTDGATRLEHDCFRLKGNHALHLEWTALSRDVWDNRFAPARSRSRFGHYYFFAGGVVAGAAAGVAVPTASAMHFFSKLALAAPASFFSADCLAQVVLASVEHFFMKLVLAAPANFF